MVAVLTLSSLAAPLAPLPARAQEDPAPSSRGSVQDEYHRALAEEAEVRARQQAALERAEQLGLELLDLDVRLASVEQELAAAEEELALKQAALDRTQADLAAVEARLVTEEQRLRNQAIQAYVGGGATPVPNLAAALRSAASADDVAKSQVYAEVVVIDRKEVVRRVDALRDEAVVLRQQADGERQAAAASRDEVGGRHAELERTREERAVAQAAATAAAAEQQELADQLELRRREYELRYAEQVSESDAITQMLAGWQKNQLPADETFGIFLNPIKNGAVVSGYGPRVHPIYGELKQHNGIDINGAMGEPMRASDNGLVILAEERGGYGLTVVIDHGNRLATLYGHMSRLDVRPGQLVQRGQPIGLVGSTGLSTGPHCHWEVRVLGLPVDGTPYLNTTPEP